MVETQELNVNHTGQERPYIEFLQSQALDWRRDSEQTGREETEVKLLSRDDRTGAATMLWRLPPGWRAPTEEWCAADEEFFVLTGSFEVNGRQYHVHHYGYWPAGFRRHGFVVGPEGLLAIVCTNATPRYLHDLGNAPSFVAAGLTEQVDTFALRWDQTNMDPNIMHLNAYRKNLRLAPDGGCRTYLLAGLPQGFPASGSEPLERHPHVEEMFMIAGDMPCSLGIMRAGSYFWRPPHIWHGADCTVTGFLLFARTPGTNRTVSNWSLEPHPVTLQPTFAPQLPEDLLRSARPAEDPIVY